MTIDEFHFVVKALGDAVIAGETPHGTMVAAMLQKTLRQHERDWEQKLVHDHAGSGGAAASSRC